MNEPSITELPRLTAQHEQVRPFRQPPHTPAAPIATSTATTDDRLMERISIAARKTTVPFLLFRDPLCREITASIIQGQRYPRINAATDVRVVVDIGASVGAASFLFALNYPDARILAIEPDSRSYQFLEQNLTSLPNVCTFGFGLYDRDCQLPLYQSNESPLANSIYSRHLDTENFAEIQLHAADTFLRHQQISVIDILKLDSEGCELPILNSLSKLLPTTQVIYLEYHDESDRLAIDTLLSPTHILVSARLQNAHRGVLCYVAHRLLNPHANLERLQIRSSSLHISPSAHPNTNTTKTIPAGDVCVQRQHEVSVVIPTVLRPSLKRAVQSVFEQQLDGPAQLLIGIDRRLGAPNVLDDILTMRPKHWTVSVFDPGYSTSVRHGGIHAAKDGGAIRTILSYLANSRYVAYLDDDNWWSADHLPSLLTCVYGYDWAHSRRWFVDHASDQPLAEDTWESVGVGKGIFAQRFGGFVDPNTLLIDKLACHRILGLWTVPLPTDAKGMSADRNIFEALRSGFRGISTDRVTCYYRMDPQDGLHPARMQLIRKLQTTGHPSKT